MHTHRYQVVLEVKLNEWKHLQLHNGVKIIDVCHTWDLKETVSGELQKRIQRGYTGEPHVTGGSTENERVISEMLFWRSC